jgi:serine/threonine protein kinase
MRQRQTFFLKVLKGTLLPDNPLQRAFLDRVSIATSVLHPGIGGVYPLESVDDYSLLPLEFVHGQTLAVRISNGRSDFDFVQGVAIQSTQALAAAHSAGLVHGRLTSNCLLMTARGELKILDFVLPHVSAELEYASPEDERFSPPLALPLPPLSSVAYQSPEQIGGVASSVASDLFALGVILYELLIGEFLFTGHDVEELRRQILSRELPKLKEVRPDAHSGWSRLLGILLNKDPAQRYPTANSLLSDLEKLKYGYSLDEPSFRPKKTSFTRRSFFRRFLGDTFE